MCVRGARDPVAIETRRQADAVVVEVRVIPRASADRIQGEHAGALKVALTAPPVEGAANEALVALIAKALGVPRRDVEIVRGQRSRTKAVRIHGVSEDAVRALGTEAGA